MKVKELLDLLKTDYVEISDDDNQYKIEYVVKDRIDKDILNNEVSSIEPITFLKKILFDSSAREGDYVAAIKISYTSDVSAEKEKVNQNEYSSTKTVWADEEDEYETEQSTIYTSAEIPPFLQNLITPEMIDQLLNSDFFRTLLDPSNIEEIITSDEFQEFIKNQNSGPMFPFDGISINPEDFMNILNRSDYDDDDEEYELVDDDYDDDDF